jgi:hypothetical protein
VAALTGPPNAYISSDNAAGGIGRLGFDGNYYAGGGGGGLIISSPTVSLGNTTVAAGGLGGGGNGALWVRPANPLGFQTTQTNPAPTGFRQSAGTANRGGGGGGAFGGGPGGAGAAGGSGVVILSIPTTKYSGTTTGSPTVTTSGANTILTYASSGTYTA